MYSHVCCAESRFNYFDSGFGIIQARVVRCARFRMRTAMAELEDSVPWEVRLLQSYCHSESDLDEVNACVYMTDWKKGPDLTLCGQQDLY